MEENDADVDGNSDHEDAISNCSGNRNHGLYRDEDGNDHLLNVGDATGLSSSSSSSNYSNSANRVQSDDNESDEWIDKLPCNLPDCDEIEEFFSKSQIIGGKKGADWINDKLFNLLCCLAGDNIAATQITDVNQYHSKLNNEVQCIVINFNKTSKFVDNLLKHLPGGALPTSLSDMIQDLSIKKASSTYNTKMRKKEVYKTVDPTVVNNCFFGQHIDHVFKHAKSEITKINSKWVETNKLRSGRNPRGLHQAIRRFYFEHYEIPEKARSYAKRRVTYLRKEKKDDGEKKDEEDNEDGNNDSADFNEEKMGEGKEIEDSKLAKLSDEDLLAHLCSEKESILMKELDLTKEFPEWWLSFLVLGLPDLIGYGVRNSFSSGRHVAKKNKGGLLGLGAGGASVLAGGDASTAQTDILSKDARKRLHGYIQGLS